jgi:hypothetical protein
MTYRSWKPFAVFGVSFTSPARRELSHDLAGDHGAKVGQDKPRSSLAGEDEGDRAGADRSNLHITPPSWFWTSLTPKEMQYVQKPHPQCRREKSAYVTRTVPIRILRQKSPSAPRWLCVVESTIIGSGRRPSKWSSARFVVNAQVFDRWQKRARGGLGVQVRIPSGNHTDASSQSQMGTAERNAYD